MAVGLGNTLRTARRITVSERSRVLRGLLNPQDKVEFYRINLSNRSRLSLTLTQLRANADVALLNRRGRAISQSRRGRTQNEAIDTLVDSGIYYLRVSLRDRGSTRFKLTASTQPISANNTAPDLVNNVGLRASQRETALITGNLLRVADLQQPSTQLVYTLTTLPQSGQLQLNGTPLAVGSRFTQADIESDRLRYVNLGTTRQLTNNTTNDTAVGISSSYVVWNGSDGDSEVFLYNIATGQTTQVTNNTTSDSAADISDANVLLSANSRVSFYNGTTGTTTPLSSNLVPGVELSFPGKISGSNVAWNSFDQSDREIMFYNGTTNTVTRLTNNAGTDNVYGISGANVVWITDLDVLGQPTTISEVFLYNGSTGQTTQLTNNNQPELSASVSGANVIWSGYDGNDFEIFVYNITTGVTTQLTNNTNQDIAPVGGISGSNIVWNRGTITATSGSVASNERLDVFLYNGVTTTKISPDNTNTIVLGISGSNVIMNSLDVNTQQFRDVFFYNGTTGLTSQITNDTTQDKAVGIAGTNLVWNRSDGNDNEVFLLTFTPTDQFSFSVTDGFNGLTNGTFNIAIG
ncbi:MAG: cadherin-like domain-containing protein [Oculatellaceae cyanobacterium bins.114]|nr:cadherin-like domain-containing protein [Oculatellaceae cyanobacterium bins.114]